MRIVLQRVSRAEVRIGGDVCGAIGPGCLLLVGFHHADDESVLSWMAQKVMSLRIFPDTGETGDTLDTGSAHRRSSFARTLEQTGGSLLVVSQFTLYGDTRKGTRPSFSDAAAPDIAVPLYERFVDLLTDRLPGRVATGEFGALMEVALVNDGPVTLVLER